MKTFKLLSFLFLIGLIGITSCKDDDDTDPVDPVDPNLFTYEEATWSEDEFITQLTVDPNGKTFCFGAGTFIFTNTIPLADISGLTLKGAGREATIFDFSNSTSTSGEGIAAIDSDNLVFCNFTVKNTNGGNGITARNIKGIRFNEVGVEWPASSEDNGTYGIYPVESDDVIVENCYAQAAIDAGIYSGQNKRVILRNNRMTLNVFGMEVENNIDAEVYGNEFFENTAGLLVYDLAGVERIKSGERTKIYNNTFTNNNQTNFAELGSTFAADVPPGIGMLFSATSYIEITNNTFVDNESVSLLGVAYFLVDQNYNPLDDLEFTFNNFAVNIHDNTYTKGGGVYNQAGVLDRPAGPLIEIVRNQNGGESPHIMLDDQDYSAAGSPFVAADPVINEPSNPDFIWANFAEAGSGVVTFTSTDENDFNTGDGYVNEGFELVDTPDECN